MAVLTAIAAVGAVVGAVGAIGSAVQAGKANAAAKKQYAYERQLANNRAAKERINTIRQARLASGALSQTVANSGGAGDSSIALGALGSIQSQLNSNLSFLDTSQTLANQAGFYASKVSIAERKAAQFGAVSQLGFQVFNMAGGREAFA